jgi:hypothetical protein
MQLPLEILDEIGQTYGPTRKLHQALANLVAATITNLERSRNGAHHQALSFSSPAHALDSRSMQLPIRMDPTLPSSRQSPIRSTHIKSEAAPQTMEAQVTGIRSQTSLGWQDPLADHLEQPDSQGLSRVVPNRPWPTMLEPGQFSPQEGFDDSILWGPSLEWTGGWDDFLNAIAM